MADFPTTLPTLATDYTCNDPRTIREAMNAVDDEVNELATKVGIDNSSDPTSLDYKVSNPSSSNPGHTHTLSTGATDVTASTGDLNATTNFEETVSATTSEVTIKTGKTLNIADDGAFKLNEVAVTSTAAELNFNDGSTAGTSVASKTLVLGSSKNTDVLTVDTILTASKGFKYNAADGHMVNGVITVSVSSNDLIVSIKTFAGTDPSATDPVYITIGGVTRTVTSALSVTLADGTNYFGSGSNGQAGNDVPYWVYAGWNVSGGAVFMGFTRRPNGSTYADFSGTNTNSRYFAATLTPSATDVVTVLGRFEATLSAAAGHTWTIANNGNVVNYPILTSKFHDYSPTFTGFSANPTWVTGYFINAGVCNVYNYSTGDGTSNATTFTFTLPIVSANVGRLMFHMARVKNNGTTATTAGLVQINQNSITADVFRDFTGTAWTNSGAKTAESSYFYDI